MSLGRLAQQTGSAGEIRRSGFTVDNMSHPADSRDEVEQNFADSVLKLRVASTPDSPGGQDLAGADPGRLGADRAALPGAVRRPAGQPPPGPGRALAACAQARFLHDRLLRPRGQRGGRRGAAGGPTRRCCTTGPARSTWPAPPAPARPGTACATCCSGWSRRRPSRSPAAGTRCSATPTLHIIPQTSTIASHLPRAVGLAFALGRAARLGAARRWPADAIVVCQPRRRLGQPLHRGRARSTPPATAPTSACRCRCCSCARTTASASACAPRRAGSRRPPPAGRASPTSTPTAPTWPASTTPRSAAAALGPGPPLPRVPAPVDGAVSAGTPARTWRPATASPRRCRGRPGRRPADRHRPAAGRGGPARPRPRCWPATSAAAARVLDARRRGGRRAAAGHGRAGDGAAGAAQPEAGPRPTRPGRRRPRTAATPRSAAGCPRTAGAAHPGPDHQRDARPTRWPRGPEMLVFGEDVARKGGVYGVTRGLPARFGAGRVFDTLLDEQSILGLALGAGLAGLLPVPEIQYLAYLHNAADQIRGEAATLPFFSQGQYRNPMVVRIAGLRLPGGLRRPLPQRQRGGRAARHPRAWSSPARPGPTTPPPMLRTCLRGGRGGRQRLRVPRADRAVPHAGPARARATAAGWPRTSRRGAGRRGHVPVGRARVHGDGRAT